MAAQDELFQLIKSLTPSEKRYFKVNGESKSNYMQLFDAMDAQKEEYDEQKLKKKHAKKAFVKYLSAEKKQLREHIMKWMRAYRADSTVDNKINDLLQDEAFYRDKGLKAQREKSILKAKELATKYERFHLLQEILERQIVYVGEFEEKSLGKPVQTLLAELQRLINDQTQFLNYWSKNKELFAMYRSQVDMKDSVVEERLESILKELEDAAPQLTEQFRLQHEIYRANANYHNTRKEWSKSFDFKLKEYELYQKNEHFKQQRSFDYKICLANLVSLAQTVGNDEVFLGAIQELKSLPQTSLNEEGEVFQNVFFLEHLFYINKGNFEKAEALVPDIIKGLEKYKAKINKARRLTFLYNIMIMYFVTHDFKEALNWSNVILEDKSEIKQNISNTTKILLPIIHFELGHQDLVDSLTRSAYRTLSSKNRLHEFEKALIKYLKGMPLSTDTDEFKQKLNDFETELNLLQANEATKSYAIEEVSLWVNSHIHSKKMSDILTSGV